MWPSDSEIDDEVDISDLRARLGEAAFLVLWAEGSAMQMDQVLEEALAT